MSTLPDAVPGIPKGGSLPPRLHPPERHRRSGGRGATATRPATCGTAGAHMEAAFSCTCTPMSMCTRGTPPTPADRRSRSAPRKPARAPCREPVDRRSGARGTEPVGSALSLERVPEATVRAAPAREALRHRRPAQTSGVAAGFGTASNVPAPLPPLRPARLVHRLSTEKRSPSRRRGMAQ